MLNTAVGSNSSSLRQVNQLKFSLVFINICLLLLLVSELLFSPLDEVEIALLVSVLLVIFLYYWSESDTVNIAIGIVLWLLTVLATYLAWRNQGLYSTAIIAFPFIILLALFLDSSLLSIPLIFFIQVVILFFIYAHRLNLIVMDDTLAQSFILKGFDVIILFSFFSILSFIYVKRVRTTQLILKNKNKLLTQQLTHTSQLINYDTLTELPNERICKQDIQRLFDTLPTSTHTVSFMTLDLHNLRSINNSLGHDVGDALIMQLAQRLLSLKKSDDYVYRFQGIEFVFVKLCRTHQARSKIKEQILQACSLPFYIHGYEIELFVSLGISLAPFDGDSIEVLRKKSHLALHQATNHSINSFYYYDESMTSTEDNKYQVLKSLKSAATNNEFELYYQPKVDLNTNLITGAEALIRWNSPEQGLVTPDKFISIAEESGIIVDITKWIINEACKTCAHWHSQGLDHLNIAINLSSVDFRRGNLPQIILKALQAHQLSPHYLELEITESMIIDDIAHIQNQIQQLHSKGITFAIDDFGTGYSNLGYLKKFNVTTLKIDRSFVQNIHDNEHDLLIVKAIINMSRSLGISNVAEGVESKAAAAMLAQLHCEYGQGYYWAKPLPAKAFITLALAQ